jgi:predicted ester cyclase
MAGTLTGRAAAEQAMRAVFDAFLDRKMKFESLLTDGDQVAQVISIEGTNIGSLMGLPPSGKPFHLTAVFLYELKDRQIVRERRIYDFTGLLVQIGTLKAKPV